MTKSLFGAFALALSLLTPGLSGPLAQTADAPLPPPATMDSGCGCEQAEPLFEAGDYDSGKLLLETLVAKGDARAMNGLGYAYENGLGVDADERKAFDLYRKSAALGYVGAENSLGGAYLNGVGVRRDPAESFRHYQAAAMRGDAMGDFHLAYAYQHGFGAPVDYARALAIYHVAAEAGDGPAMNQIGFMYQHGLGQAADAHLAFCWYAAAMTNGYPQSHGHVAELVGAGFVIPAPGPDACSGPNAPSLDEFRPHS
jgi:hypothetical protein